MGLSYKDTVLADGPILFWRMDEAVGTIGTQISDASGFGLTGTIKFGATTPTSSLAFNEYYGVSPVSGAMFVNSTTPRILMTGSQFGISGSATDVSPSSSFTVEWWVKNLSFSNFNNNLGFGNFTAAGDAWGWFLAHHDANGGIYCGIHVNDRFTPNELGATRTGATYHYVFTWVPGTGSFGLATFYKNGFKVAERLMQQPASNWSTAIGSPDGVGTINAGAAFGFGDGSNGWNATYDNLAVYNKALTPDRVRAHFLSGTANPVLDQYASMIIMTNPTAYYRLNDATGSTPNFKDSSQTAAAPGTLIGGAAGIQFQQQSLVDGGFGTGSSGLSGSTAGNAPYINVPTSLGVGGNASPFTVSWWQRVSAFPTGSAVNNTIGAGFTTFFAGCSGSTGEGFMAIGSTDLITPKDLGRGWYNLNQNAHYCFMYDGSNFCYIWKNGKLMFWKRIQPGSAWGANGFKIGSGSIGGEYSEVVVYNTTMYKDEITRHYVMGLGTSSLPAPTVVSVQAFSGSIYSGSQVLTTGGSYILVSGSNFQPNMRAYVNGVAVAPFLFGQGPGSRIGNGLNASNIFGSDGNWENFQADVVVGVSGSQFLALAPTGTIGSASIQVLNPDGQSATGSNLLLYVTGSDAYHSQIIADQPVLYWRLDDGSGSYRLPSYVVKDTNDVLYWTLDEFGAPFSSSGNGSILPLYNRISGSVTGSTGVFNSAAVTGAAAFPGQAGGQNFFYLDTGVTGTTLHEITSNFSVGCWVYVLDYGYVNGGPGNYSSIVGKAYRPDASGWTAPFWAWELQFLNDGTGRLFGSVTTGATQRGVESNFVVPLNQWIHIGMTYDGSNIRVYGNGTLQQTTAIASTIDYGTHGPYRVGGGYFSGSDGFHGLIDDIRIANVTRDATYFGQFSGSGGPSLVQDWSGNNNTGSVYQAYPNLLFRQPGLIASAPNMKAMTNIASDSPVPFIANTGDQNGTFARPSCNIGTGSFTNPVLSFSVEWWHRRDLGPLLVAASAIGTFRFGFAQGQFLANIVDSSGRINVGTDAANVMNIANFVDPTPTYPTRQHHYCYTFQDAGNGTGTGIMYRDGIQIASNASQKTPLGWQAFEAIGPFSGTFDETAVYPYALTQPQIYMHYALGSVASFDDSTARRFSGSLAAGGLQVPTGAEDFAPTTTGSIFFFLNTGSLEGLIVPFGAEDFALRISGSLFSEGAAGSFSTGFLPDFSANGLMLIQAIQGAGGVDPGQGVPPSPHPEMANVENLFQAGSGSVTSGGGGGGGGVTPAPVIQNFSPSVGSLILSGTVLSFDVVDAGGVAPVYCAILANFQGIAAQEIVYNSVSFNSMYSNVSNTVSSSASGSVLHFTMLRNGGWPSTVTLTPVAFSSGSENT